MQFVAAGRYTRKWLKLYLTIRNLTFGDMGILLVVMWLGITWLTKIWLVYLLDLFEVRGEKEQYDPVCVDRLRMIGLLVTAAGCYCKYPNLFNWKAECTQANHCWYCELMLKTNDGRNRRPIFAVSVVWSASYALVCESARGASHHLAFMGSHLAVSHTLLALPTQWTSSPSKKWGLGVSPRLHLIVSVSDVNQVN